MRRYFFFGALSAAILALFLVLRPLASGWRDTSPPPDTRGRAKALLPEETTEHVTPVPLPTAALAKPEAPLSDVEQQIVTLTNEERRRAGAPPLAADGFLLDAARKHSDDMLLRNFMDHVNPDGLTPEDRVARESRRAIGTIRENLWSASGAGVTRTNLAQKIVASWMSSPGHRENILQSDLTHIGVGVVPAGGEMRATQVFARIVALTGSPIPPMIRRGELLPIVVEPASPSVRCDAVDVFSTSSGLAVLGPVAPGNVKMEIAPGVYKLRFHCSASGSARAIFAGPHFEVKE